MELNENNEVVETIVRPLEEVIEEKEEHLRLINEQMDNLRVEADQIIEQLRQLANSKK